jgi:SNF2 family DNA or RNA helicase
MLIGHVLKLIMKLKQICNFCTYSNQSAKLSEMRERLETLVAEGHRAIIFSQFTDDRFGCKAIAGNLMEYNPLVFTGEQSSKEKDRTVLEFKAAPAHKVMILSLRAGGQGLNLQDASYVFHFDRWWNPAAEKQAEDRSHRLGQLNPVNVYRYIMEDTIEERIDAILKTKQKLFEAYVDGVTIDLKSFLTKEEMLGLFGL